MVRPSLTLLTWAAGVTSAVAADGHGICPGDSPQHSGYLPAGPNASYFYYLAASRSATPEADPLVIWFTGGPGCSSMLALLTENGPCSIAGHGAAGWQMKHNPWSWSEVANVVWIDQPVGVGYSAGNAQLAQNEGQVAERMFAFLQNFYKKFPQFLSVPLFLTGESFAGHYVPAVAARVVDGQQDGVGMLQGIAIGNAEVDPALQWSTKPEMAFTGGSGGSLQGGVVSSSQHRQMELGMPTCQQDILRCQQLPQPGNCMTAMMDCAMAEIIPIRASGRNPYDLRKNCSKDLNMSNPATALCYDFTKETNFMNDPEVKQKFGAHAWRQWSSCNITAMLPFLLSGDEMRNYRSDITKILGAGVRVLVYAGDTDSQVDWLGCRRWVENLPWPHQKEWLAAPQERVYLRSEQKGVSQSAEGLTFLQIFDSGHMVPLDQPEFALAMLRDFMKQPSSSDRNISYLLAGPQGESSDAPGAAVAFGIGLLLASVPACSWLSHRSRRREEGAGYFLMI